jgi:uncharacterized membrane protein
VAVVRRLCVSFFVIGIIWVNHHAGLHDIARVDQMAMFVTLLLLMFVTAIPFSTAALASYLHHGGRDGQLTVAIYGLPVIGMALRFTALCAWAARRGMLHATDGGRRAVASVRCLAAGTVAISAAIGVAFVSAMAAMAALAAHMAIAARFCVERSPAAADR